MSELSFYTEIIDTIIEKKLNKKEIQELKSKLAKKHNIIKVPTDIEITLNSNQEQLKKLNMITKPSRSNSGVSVVAIMTYPFSCKHGKCIFCPGGPKSVYGDTPQSYTGHEPASMRGKRNNYDAYLQVFNRLEQYVAAGHPLDKIELIIMGGTFPSYELEYQDNFIRDAFCAMNDFSDEFIKNNEINFLKYKEFFEMPGIFQDENRTNRIHKRIFELKSKNQDNLENSQIKNETSSIRCVALAIETRPDYCNKEHINQMLKLGATRVELGVQTVYEDVMQKIDRNHSVKDVIFTTKLLKDSLLKVGYHIMPGLLGSNKEKDIEMFKILFESSDFKPDALKIYPCMVMPGTKLYDLYIDKKFNPITTEDAIEIIANGKKYVPNYCRIMRVQRDIPTNQTTAGVNVTNFRQLLDKYLIKNKIKCNCIRCREIKNKKVNLKNAEIIITKYDASSGIEYFISYESDNQLLGFLRLRILNEPFREELLNNTAGVRELHVYGKQIKIDSDNNKDSAIQHKGIGKSLLIKAEEIAKENKMKKIAVISGIGVREYYKKLGYNKEGIYMVKYL